PMRKRLLASALLTTALVLLGGAGAWWHHTSRPEYLLRQGQAALHRGDTEAADALAARLEASGHADHARLLSGQVYLHLKRPARGRSSTRPATRAVSGPRPPPIPASACCSSTTPRKRPGASSSCCPSGPTTSNATVALPSSITTWELPPPPWNTCKRSPAST